MKKEEIVTLIIIGIILAIDLVTLCYTKKCIAKITDDLTNLEETAIASVKNDTSSEDESNNKNVGDNIDKNENNDLSEKNKNDKDKNSSKEENKNIEAKSTDELKNQSNDIYKEWIKMNDILTYYIEHDELEKVNVQFEKIMGDYSVDAKEDAVPEINEAIYILKHIEKKQRLTLRNIF